MRSSRRLLPLSWTWLFAALVAAGVVASAVLVVVRAPAPIAEFILRDEKIGQARLWVERVLYQLDTGRWALRSGRFGEEEKARLARIPTASDVFDLVLFDRTGKVVWAPDAAEIGTEADPRIFRQLAMLGEPVYVRENVSARDVPNLRLHASGDRNPDRREIAEVYVPVTSGGEFVGAMEFYIDVTEERALYIARVRAILALLVAMGGLLVLVPLFVSLRHGAARMRAVSAAAAADRERMSEQLRLAREVRILGELNEWLQLSRSLDELFVLVGRFLERMLPDSDGTFYIYSNSRDVLDGMAGWGEAAPHAHIRPQDCWALRRGRPYRFGRGEVDFPCDHVGGHDERSYFCFPILAHGETVGLMHMSLRSAGDRDAFETSYKLARMCAEQVALAVANVRLRDELHEQSLRDPLTGLHNRRYVGEALGAAIATARARGGTLAVVSLDVDHFKRFNDDHGHEAGDAVLDAVGASLREDCAGEDVACRYGGEEFMLLWPGLGADEALARADRLRATIAGLAVRYAGRPLPPIMVSIGIAVAFDHGNTPQELMRTADEALYAAKEAGRNRAVVADPPARRAGARRPSAAERVEAGAA